MHCRVARHYAGVSVSPAEHGFTLVEISVVLVILGLLVGGVVAGQNLIRAAELRSVTTELNQFTTASNAFMDKYSALPGDMPNAIDYWTAANSSPATCQSTVGSGTQTCNGNGDGFVGGIPATMTTSDYNALGYEVFRFWQQLAIAGLIEGSFTGTTGTGFSIAQLRGTNVPAGRITNSAWDIAYWGLWSSTSQMVAGQYGHVLSYGAVSHADAATTGIAAMTRAWGPVLRAEEAAEIDEKIDDGVYVTGNVRTYRRAFQTDCIAAGDADYDVSNNLAEACAIIFLTGF